MYHVSEQQKTFYVTSLPWPVRSPELTVPDIYLCGYLQECVYRNRPPPHTHTHTHTHTTQKMKRALGDETANTNQELLGQF